MNLYNITLVLRNLQKNAAFTLIHAVGLSLGMTAFILITQYVTFEKSYNAFHENLPTLYRVVNEKAGGAFDAYSAPGITPLAANKISGIDQYCRIAEGANLGTGIVSYQKSGAGVESSFREESFIYADANFFRFFTFSVKAGDGGLLSRPNVVALSMRTARRYFGNESALGKTITLNNQFGQKVYTVEAIYDDMPEYSDLRYKMVFSIQTLYGVGNLNGNEVWASMEGTGSQWLYTYLNLNESASAVSIAAQYTQILRQVNPDEQSNIVLQPVSGMHLGRSMSDPLPTFGSLRFVYLLAGIAALILAIAWFNYINLSTASALRRAKEVGIRKVVGASRRQLIWHFLGESSLLHAISFVLAIALVSVLQTPYAIIIGKHITPDILTHNQFWIVSGSILVTGTLAAGVYIAFLLSSFHPSRVLKGIFSKSDTGVLIRKSLVVIQFTISLMLIAATIILFQQWKYMQNKDLGMDASQLLVIRGAEVHKDGTFNKRSASFENDLGSASFIQNFCRSGNVPTDGFNYSTSGITRLSSAPGDEKVNYDILTIDNRYLDVYGIGLVSGENFTPEMCSRSWNEMAHILLNERASAAMGFPSTEAAIGQKIKWNDREFVVHGVVKDYHHLSVHYGISPVVFLPSNAGGYYTLQVATRNFGMDLPTLEAFYKSSFPGNPFEFQFLDDQLARKYASQEQQSIIFTVASCLAIFISCLGLFGLAAYSVEQRTKEIGIRKILGSSNYQLVNLFSKDFLSLIAIAFAMSVPASWWLMNNWLQGFAYRVTIEWWVFGLSGVTTLMIAWITVGSQALKSAVSNPVKSLRAE